MFKKKFIWGLVVMMMVLSGAVFADELAANVAGTWSITIKFIAGEGHHTAIITQKDSTLTGIYKGEFKEGTLSGKVKGKTIDFTGRLRHEATGIHFRYKGAIDGDSMKGTVDMGEFWTATFTAKREKK